jgi:hypothetical protein
VAGAYRRVAGSEAAGRAGQKLCRCWADVARFGFDLALVSGLSHETHRPPPARPMTLSAIFRAPDRGEGCDIQSFPRFPKNAKSVREVMMKVDVFPPLNGT